MTRIAVFSDTHGSLSNLPAALQRLGPVDAFLHLGDYAGDAARIAKLCPVPYFSVRGNCDMGGSAPGERVVTYENAALLCTHGDSLRSLEALAARAETLGCKAALFGHTHTPLLEARGKILLINPGSLSRPRFSSAPGCCLLTIENGDVFVKMIAL